MLLLHQHAQKKIRAKDVSCIVDRFSVVANVLKPRQQRRAEVMPVIMSESCVQDAHC